MNARAGLGGGITQVVATLAIALSEIGTAIALAALIFSGPLADGLPRATTSFVLGTALVAGYVGWRSRIVPAIAVAQDGPAVVMVALAASFTAAGAGGTATDVLVLVGLGSLLAGLIMVLLARFSLGNVVRYLPTTLVASFIAGTGWLLVKGGFEVMVRRSLGLGDLGDLLRPEVAQFWLPGFVLALVIQAFRRVPKIPAVASSALVLGSVGLFYLVVAVRSSVAVVEQEQWLVGPFPAGTGLRVLTSAELQHLGAQRFLTEIPALASVVAVAVVALLLNLSALEFVDRDQIDLDLELHTAGVANLVAAPFGAPIGFHSFGRTLLVGHLGARGRVVPLGAAALCLVFALAGAELAGFVPRLVAGGLLVAIGLGLLIDWIQSLAHALGWVERILGVSIVVVIAWLGILQGIGAGVAAACAIFVFRYSRVDPVRRALTGQQTRSRVDHLPGEEQFLRDRGDFLSVLELQGYLFFGSLTGLAERVRTRCTDPLRQLDAVILDFRHVTGVDSSGFDLLAKLARQVNGAGADLVFSSVRPEIWTALTRGSDQTRPLRGYSTLDLALEAVQEKQLRVYHSTGLREFHRGRGEGTIDLAPELEAIFVASTIKTGTVLLQPGERCDKLYLVRSGTLLSNRIEPDGTRRRLRRFSEGFVGEIGFVTNRPEISEVVAESEVELLHLDRAEYERLRRDQPHLALQLHDLIMTGLAQLTASLRGLTDR